MPGVYSAVVASMSDSIDLYNETLYQIKQLTSTVREGNNGIGAKIAAIIFEANSQLVKQVNHSSLETWFDETENLCMVDVTELENQLNTYLGSVTLKEMLRRVAKLLGRLAESVLNHTLISGPLIVPINKKLKEESNDGRY